MSKKTPMTPKAAVRIAKSAAKGGAKSSNSGFADRAVRAANRNGKS